MFVFPPTEFISFSRLALQPPALNYWVLASPGEEGRKSNSTLRHQEMWEGIKLGVWVRPGFQKPLSVLTFSCEPGIQWVSSLSPLEGRKPPRRDGYICTFLGQPGFSYLLSALWSARVTNNVFKSHSCLWLHVPRLSGCLHTTTLPGSSVRASVPRFLCKGY